jgi:uncharacterized protein YcbK (DUF882 family)
MVQRSGTFCWLCSLAVILALGGGSTRAAGEVVSSTSRFFLAGDGRLHIQSVKNGRVIDVQFVNGDGSLNEAALARIGEVLDFSPGHGVDRISPRLLFMLDHFSDRVAPGKVIRLTSGYRSPEYNEKLRNAGGNVASTSLHQDGMAMDFHIDGIGGRDLWKLIKEADCCGVGHYGGADVHLDVARPRFWEAATSKVRTGESEHNRRIYLTTDFDRYRPGDRVNLSLVSISDFGFGLAGTAWLVRDREGEEKAREVQLLGPADASCHPVTDRVSARAVFLRLPQGADAGRYRIRTDFCRRPFDDMPPKAISNEIEITGNIPAGGDPR